MIDRADRPPAASMPRSDSIPAAGAMLRRASFPRGLGGALRIRETDYGTARSLSQNRPKRFHLNPEPRQYGERMRQNATKCDSLRIR